MTVWYKQGVLGDPSNAMLKARNKIHRYYQNTFGEDLFITSIRDGNHSAGSLHYRGDAEDYRFPKARFGSQDHEYIKNILGPNYDVVVERSHLHVEYDPN